MSLKKSGQFLQTKGLYSSFELTNQEKLHLKQNKSIQNLNLENSQIVDSDKCNLQIKMPKKLSNSELKLESWLNNQYFTDVSLIISVGKQIPKEKISKSGDILEIDAFSPNQEFKLICADKQTILDIFSQEEIESLKGFIGLIKNNSKN